MSKREFVCYHGTDINSARDIVKNQNFTDSEDDSDWLGKGVYLYDCKENALEYITKKFIEKYGIDKLDYNNLLKKYQILVVHISIEDNNIFDFNDFQGKYKYVFLCNGCINKIKNNPRYLAQRYKDGFMLKYLVEETNFFKFDALTNIFVRNLPEKNTELEANGFKSRIAYDIKQRYICVSNHKCITKVEYLKEDLKEKFEIINDIYNWGV